MNNNIACSACYGTGYGVDGKPCPCGCRPAPLPAAPAPTGIPAFNPNAKCSPLLTQCPRCNNPHHACDQNLGVSMPAPAPTAPVVFGMRGPKMTFTIGVQSFTLDYEPDEPGAFEYMAAMLSKAIERAALPVEQAGELPPLPVATLAITRGIFDHLKEAKISLLSELPAGTYGLFTSTQLRSHVAQQAPTEAPKEDDDVPVLSAVRHAIYSLKEYRAGRALSFPVGAIDILERFADARQAPDSRDAALKILTTAIKQSLHQHPAIAAEILQPALSNAAIAQEKAQ